MEANHSSAGVSPGRPFCGREPLVRASMARVMTLAPLYRLSVVVLWALSRSPRSWVCQGPARVLCDPVWIMSTSGVVIMLGWLSVGQSLLPWRVR